MPKLVVTDSSKCTGCRLCEMACSSKKTGRINPANSMITSVMHPREPLLTPVTCYHCEYPACEEVCPSGAIYRDEDTGAVVLDEERCIKCKTCMMFCPYGNIKDIDGRVLKCDLCGGDPECVKFCVPGAITFVDLSDIQIAQRTYVTQKLSGIN